MTDVEEVPEVAFTGDTTAEFLTDPGNADVLRAKLLIMEVRVRSKLRILAPRDLLCC